MSVRPRHLTASLAALACVALVCLAPTTAAAKTPPGDKGGAKGPESPCSVEQVLDTSADIDTHAWLLKAPPGEQQVPWIDGGVVVEQDSPTGDDVTGLTAYAKATAIATQGISLLPRIGWPPRPTMDSTTDLVIVDWPGLGGQEGEELVGKVILSASLGGQEGEELGGQEGEEIGLLCVEKFALVPGEVTNGVQKPSLRVITVRVMNPSDALVAFQWRESEAAQPKATRSFPGTVTLIQQGGAASYDALATVTADIGVRGVYADGGWSRTRGTWFEVGWKTVMEASLFASASARARDDRASSPVAPRVVKVGLLGGVLPYTVRVGLDMYAEVDRPANPTGTVIMDVERSKVIDRGVRCQTRDSRGRYCFNVGRGTSTTVRDRASGTGPGYVTVEVGPRVEMLIADLVGPYVGAYVGGELESYRTSSGRYAARASNSSVYFSAELGGVLRFGPWSRSFGWEIFRDSRPLTF
ncbi:MAG: hypothetical protein ACKOAW_08515 [Actinomycetota bacterium]